MIDEYNDGAIPLKIRKISLLQAVELPTAEVEILETGETSSLKKSIEDKIEQNPLIARFACIPNRLGIPSVYINRPEEKVVALFEISKIINLYPEIKNIILQEATKETSTFDKISGRLLLENNNLHSSREEVLEIYKGARETGILNRVNVVDNNFLVFEKKLGEFMKPIKRVSKNSQITENDIRIIWYHLEKNRNKIKRVQSIILNIEKQEKVNSPLIFEFSFRDGKFVFNDID